MLEAGKILGDRYQLKEMLGRNAGRQTWLASDQHSDPQGLVVVKLLAFGGEVQWDDLKLFEREAQTLKQLNHPQIPQYYDYFSVDERTLWFGLVQQYIPGFSFKQLLEQGQRLTEKKIEQIVEDILQILIYLHELNPTVLHRDIKPSNLLLGENGKVYLVDFGAVQAKAAEEGATFTVVGTYGYTPMEQFGGRAVPASDLYALGATIVHMLTSVAPADLPHEDLRLQFRDRLQVQHLSSRLIQWLEKVTEPAVSKRFPSAQEALAALQDRNFAADPQENPPPNAPSFFANAVQITPPPTTAIQVDGSPEELKISIPSTLPWLENMPVWAIILTF
ncbi:MAG: serine/threonine protein kinase, partial [Okeania sp. SIO2D1]|nr:serine/threonine protein kinase [Okeania sp. SIO2D1]